LVLSCSHRGNVSVRLVQRQQRVDGGVAILRPGKQARQIPIRVGTNHDIDQLVLLEEFLFQSFSHTSEHPDDTMPSRLRVLKRSEFVEPVPDPVDGARFEQF
jgi:hypothetical protein